MELDDLKEAWTALDSRFKKNEELKESIILEMMKSKAGKQVNKFIKGDIISVIILLLIIPLIIFQIDRGGGKYWAWDILMIFAILVACWGACWGVYKIHGLMKFDFSKNVSNNIYCVNKYNIQLKQETKITVYFIVPVFAVLGVLAYATMKATTPLWIFLICIFAIAILSVYWACRMNNKNISSIMQSLNEIKDLKEEE